MTMTNPLATYMDDYLEEDLEKEAAPKINLIQPKFQFNPPAPPTFPQPPGLPPTDLTERQQHELNLWHTWNNGGRKPEDLQPLVHSIRPLVQDSVNTWKGRVRYIPDEALESEFMNHAVGAIKTFDPDRGAKLSTWVRTNLRKGGRFVKTYQNVGRIVEERAGLITEFKNAKADLAEQFGRPAQDHELIDHLNTLPGASKKWSPAEVQRMNSELRADIMSSTFESDPTTWTPELDSEIMSHLDEELSPQERQVFQHIQQPGQTQGKTGLIAQQLGWSASKVSRLRKAIQAKAMHYQRTLGGR